MKILIVEDEQAIADNIKQGLENKGYAVDHARDGKEGIVMGNVNEYDLAIIDIKLPHKNGVEVCGELRAAGKEFPILMLSVEFDVETKVQALNAGADDYLTKPFVFSELAARIQALLRRERKITGPVIEAGLLSIDLRTHEAWCSNKPLLLSKKEFALLEYFMRNQGSVLTRGMLLEHVWDTDIDPFTNTVDVHVRSLRKHLGKRAGDYIQTVRGYGYRFLVN